MKRLIIFTLLMAIFSIGNAFSQSTSKKRAVYHEPYSLSEDKILEVKDYSLNAPPNIQQQRIQHLDSELGIGTEITLPVDSDVAHYDISLAINPNNPDHVVASTLLLEWDGSLMGYALGANFFKSNDGCQNWSGGDEAVDYPNRGYQTISFNQNDRVFISHADADKGVSMSYTSNNGLTWNTKVVAEAPGGAFGYNREGSMCIDNFSTGLQSGNVYCVWHRQGSLINNEQIMFSKSTNSGLTWSPEVGISSEIGYYADNNFPDIATGPNGEVYVCWLLEEVYTCDETAIGFNASLTGGLVWQTERKIHDQIRAPYSTQPKTFRIRSSPSIACDVSDGPFRGDIYVVWCNVGYPGENDGENPDVYIMKSDDEGQTWSDPVQVNTDPVPGGSSQVLPVIACDPVTGILSVIYYDDRDCGLEELNVWIANSYDGGQSWENFKINDETILIREFFEDSHSFLNKIDITSFDHQVVPGWLGVEDLKPVVRVAPYETISLAWPYLTNLDIDQLTGSVNLEWGIFGDGDILHYNIFRDDVLISTTGSQSFMDELPAPGTYTYKITVQHASGESGSTSRTCTWGDADLFIQPNGLQMKAAPGISFSRKIVMENQGLLDLNYQITPKIHNDNVPLPDYCIPWCGGGVFVRNVNFGDINKYSFWDGYEDHYSCATKATPGGLDTITVQVRNWLYGWENVKAKAWVDWNRDGNFEADELNELEIIDTWRQYFQTTIEYPEDILPGKYRMRVYGGQDNLGPCDSLFWDEHEDYQIYYLSWIADSTFTGSLGSESSEMGNVWFNTTGLNHGSYTVDLVYSDKVTGEVLETVQTFLFIDSVNTAPPANLTALANGPDVQLSWEEPANGDVPNYYTVYRYGNNTIKTFESSGLSYIDEAPGVGHWQYEVMAVYDEGESVPAGPVAVELTGMLTAQIQLAEGWSGIASYIQPVDSTLEAMFAGMNDMIILYNDNGVFYPTDDLNTLGYWDASAGYICKMGGASLLGITGYPIENSEIQLHEGWNILPVLSSNPIAVEALFGDNLDQVEIVKEIAGYQVFWPSKNINQIGLLEPGKAYFVKMSNPLVLSY